jgi:hypothetical protein
VNDFGKAVRLKLGEAGARSCVAAKATTTFGRRLRDRESSHRFG